MKVFSIEGKFQQNGRYSKLPTDFKGFFVFEESGKIKGYMVEQYASIFCSERYIYGKYDEAKNRLVYLKMSTEIGLSPLLYYFPNLSENGWWSSFSPFFGVFFPFGQAEGYAKATISEETTKSPDEILAIYNKVIADNNDLNMALIKNGVYDYIFGIF